MLSVNRAEGWRLKPRLWAFSEGHRSLPSRAAERAPTKADNRSLGNSRRKVAGFALGGEAPRCRSLCGGERIELIAGGVDDAIGDGEASIDLVASLEAPVLVAIRAQGIDIVVARP